MATSILLIASAVWLWTSGCASGRGSAKSGPQRSAAAEIGGTNQTLNPAQQTADKQTEFAGAIGDSAGATRGDERSSAQPGLGALYYFYIVAGALILLCLLWVLFRPWRQRHRQRPS